MSDDVSDKPMAEDLAEDVIVDDFDDGDEVEDLTDDFAEGDAGVGMFGQGDRVAHRVRRRPGPGRKEDRRGRGAGA